ncbi:uncharacterized protein LOC110817687 [Carica papaya]|uniref:uncharacterized protein LOC110817687 n=1 Tax=Carica papaya TaxID=3649 RepID=UPI000B8CBE4F|nr:uncharacterized protein LOC110817687 [Carica papaya]
MGIVNLVYQNLCLLIIFLTRDLEKLALKYMTLSSLDQNNKRKLSRKRAGPREERKDQRKGESSRFLPPLCRPAQRAAGFFLHRAQSRATQFLLPPHAEMQRSSQFPSSPAACRDARPSSFFHHTQRREEALGFLLLQPYAEPRDHLRFLLPPHAEMREDTIVPASSATRRAAGRAARSSFTSASCRAARRSFSGRDLLFFSGHRVLQICLSQGSR